MMNVGILPLYSAKSHSKNMGKYGLMGKMGLRQTVENLRNFVRGNFGLMPPLCRSQGAFVSNRHHFHQNYIWPRA